MEADLRSVYVGNVGIKKNSIKEFLDLYIG
jgi:hypothetical protein